MQKIQIPGKLVTTSSTQQKDFSLAQKTFVQVKSNGIWSVQPPAVHFSGFIAQTHQSKTFKLTNISNAIQRLHIIPCTTPFFSLKYKKRGQVAPGNFESIEVIFTPPDWRYFYDCIRIHCEKENILIPIYAYPVMNDKERYVPQLLDLGKCDVGDQLKHSFDLICQIPVNFEFEFELVKAHPDITLNPMSGIVKGNSTKSVEVIFNPKAPVTAYCECLFRLSEFNFQPQSLKIICSALPKKQIVKRLLAQKPLDKTISTQQQQEKVADVVDEQDKEKDDLQNYTKSVKSKMTSSRITSQVQKIVGKQLEIKGIDRTIIEQQFNQAYRQLEQLDREKEIKFFSCIGDPYPELSFLNFIQQKRIQNQMTREKLQKKMDCSRAKIERDNDKVITSVGFTLVDVQPTWDEYKNNDLTLRSLALKRFIDAANTILVRLRAKNRLNKIKERLQINQVKSKEDVEAFIQQDWKEAEQQGIGGFELKVAAKFECKEEYLSLAKLVLQYEGNVQEYKQQVEAVPITGFSDLAQFEFIEQQDYELANYKDFDAMTYQNYFPVDNERNNRTGAEEEYYSVGASGTVSELKVYEIPEICNDPYYVEPSSLVLPHPFLRSYASMNRQSEVDPEYIFKPENISKGNLKDFLKERGEFSMLSPEEPGLSSVDFLTKSNIPSFFTYFKQRKQVPNGLHNETYLQAVPEELQKVQVADQLSDSDSESENQAVMEKYDYMIYYKRFEIGIEQEEQKCVNAEQEMTNTINNDIRQIRRKQAAWLPARMTVLNTTARDIKFFIM